MQGARCEVLVARYQAPPRRSSKEHTSRRSLQDARTSAPLRIILPSGTKTGPLLFRHEFCVIYREELGKR